jgi:Na+/melibiose symporter-like transporter
VSGECFQEDKAKAISLAIKMLISPPPLIFMIIICISIAFYPIDSKRANSNSDKLKELNL